ncbi:MAG: TrmO family methyltransferase domain-containing protein [Candidatus Dormibacteria bacterium]
MTGAGVEAAGTRADGAPGVIAREETALAADLDVAGPARVSEFTRGAVRLHVLHHADEGGVHGAWMAAELARHGYTISPGTLYPLLHRLQDEGLLTSRQDTVDGKVRRLYTLTTAGRAKLAAEKSALAELAREVLTGGGPAGGQAMRGGTHFRKDLVTDTGGKQILLDDPPGNRVELSEPARTEAQQGTRVHHATFEAHPIGQVHSSLTQIADAPNQGDQGAPDAWLVIDPELREGIRDITVGTDLLVFTWLHQSRRDELSTVPGDDPTGRPRGVFSTRSPARTNPIGLHRVTVSAVDLENTRVQVRPLEAIDGTPVIDLKPVIHPSER